MNELIAEILFVLSAVTLYMVFKYGYKKAIIESHRQKLFEYRSMLYGLLHKEKIDPNHPAYRHVENHLNRLLRYAHWTTTLRILFTLFVVWMGWYEPKSYKDYLKGIPETDDLPKDVREKLSLIKEESFNAVPEFLPWYSPAWFIVKPLLIGLLKIRSAYKNRGNDLDRRAISKEYDLAQYNEKRGGILTRQLSV